MTCRIIILQKQKKDSTSAERQKSSTVGLLINPDDLHLSLRLDTVRLGLHLRGLIFTQFSLGRWPTSVQYNFKSSLLKSRTFAARSNPELVVLFVELPVFCREFDCCTAYR